MALKSKEISAAASYAQALLELANEANQAEQVGAELEAIAQIVQADASFRLFLADPGINVAEHQQVLDRVLKPELTRIVFNTLAVMNLKGRLSLLPEVARAYRAALDKQLGRIDVDVTVAQRLDDAQVELVRQNIQRAFNKTPNIRQHEDASILGGLIIRIEDKLIDGSVRAQLHAMKRKLLASAK